MKNPIRKLNPKTNMKTKLDHLITALALLALATLGSQLSTARAQSFQPIYSFTNGPAYPQTGLVQGPDGNFYGTTGVGGNNVDGTVFKVATNGTLTVLHYFNGNDGGIPSAGLTLGTDGRLYGTTSGGINNAGTVFQITTNGTLTTLYSFSALSYNTYPYTNSDGARPSEGSLTLGSDGKFYGTTVSGGANGQGTVFQMTTNGTLTTLHSITPTAYDGNAAYTNYDGSGFSGLALGSDGNLYGTASQGGANGNGTVFQVTTNGIFTTLHSFTSDYNGPNITPTNPDGANPNAGLTLGSDGNLYGTTSWGGTNNAGTVFQIATNGGFPGEFIALASFDGTVFSSGGSATGLASGPDGNLYGTTKYGGSSYAGTVFKVTTSGVLTLLYSFTALVGNTNSDGNQSYAGLTLGTDGSFYGTTYQGGSDGYGTAFRVTTNGVLTSLCSFAWDIGGVTLTSGLTLGSDGNLYGTTEQGGISHVGTVFKVTTNGTLTSLADFAYDNGSVPNGLTLGLDGNFYGTTGVGGSNGNGTVFKVTTNGVLTSLYSFSALSYNTYPYTNSDGVYPEAGLTLGPDGNFYGTTMDGGANGYGTVFQVTTNGTLTTLHSFTTTVYDGTGYYTNFDGANPSTSLALGPDGNLYGTTEGGGVNGQGTVFQMTTNGTLNVLVNFAYNTNGSAPNGLILGSDGNFYGTTKSGGAYSFAIDGTVFKLTTNGVLTTLYSFSPLTYVNPVATNSDGAEPTSLALGPDGNLYGTTAQAGANGYGTVFQVTTSGVFTALASFNVTDGQSPAGLTFGPDGNFYGTTFNGGSGSGGVIYRAILQGATGITFVNGGNINYGGQLVLGGGSGSGQLSVGNAGQFQSAGAILGGSGASNNVAMISGSGSVWTSTSDVIVGQTGWAINCSSPTAARWSSPAT